MHARYVTAVLLAGLSFLPALASAQQTEAAARWGRVQRGESRNLPLERALRRRLGLEFFRHDRPS